MSSSQVVFDPALVEQIRQYAWEQQLGLTVCSCDCRTIVLHSTSFHNNVSASRNLLHSISPLLGNVHGPLVGALRFLRNLVSTYFCVPVPLNHD